MKDHVQARANLSALADSAEAGADRLERAQVHLMLITDARRGLADIDAGRTEAADAAIAQLQQLRAAPAKSV